MLAIHAGSTYLPERMPFDTVQAEERHFGYLHLLFGSAVFARPRGKGKLREGEAERHAPAKPCSLPIAAPAQGLGFLAVAAAKSLREQVGKERMAKTTHIVVVHASLNQHIAESVSGRVQHELGLKDVMPFAISQIGSLGMYAALPLIEGLLRRAEAQILLVATDKWLYPFFRAFGGLVTYGDGAAALLLRRDDGAQPFATVRGYTVEHGTAVTDPWALDAEQLQNTLVPLAAAAGRRALANAQIRADRVDELIAPGWDDSFTDAVASALEIPAARRIRREQSGHLSSADGPVALLQRHRALGAGARRTVLLWDATPAGAAGAMVVELHGTNGGPAA